jgi:hypothetical protein
MKEESMRPVRFLLALRVLTLPAALPAADPVDVSWDRLRSLVGEWQGRYGDGSPATVSYRLVSSGTAVMETLEASDSSQMITVYHRDGTSILMTHYCSMGNQSRMRAKGIDGERLGFALVDSTNVKAPEDHRMTALVLSFSGPDRLTHEWTSKAGTTEQTGRLEFVRKN